jgi:hypothetical protein
MWSSVEHWWHTVEAKRSPATHSSVNFVVVPKCLLCVRLACSELAQPTNALAALANLAPHTLHIHTHAAQKLLTLLQLLGKR